MARITARPTRRSSPTSSTALLCARRISIAPCPARSPPTGRSSGSRRCCAPCCAPAPTSSRRGPMCQRASSSASISISRTPSSRVKSRASSTACSTASRMCCAPAIWRPAVAAQSLGEFERIRRFFAPLAAPGALGLRDDAALIDGPDGQHYVLTADAIVEGVHFLSEDPPAQVAQKLLRVNLSDLAAKGAEPVGYLLVTALPRARDEAWLEAFAAGLAADQARFGIGLLGGDSTATDGPATLSVTALGRVASGRAVLRSGARAGDSIYVSGTLGDAALGLQALRGELPGIAAEARDFLAGRYRLPQPRLALGQRLVGVAHAMMDISDGLVADLGHIVEASGVGAVIEAALLPLSPAARSVIAAD